MKEFGKVLKIARIANNLTTKEAAERMQVRSSYISAIENGTRKGIRRETLTKFADVYSYKASEICFLEEYYESLVNEDDDKKYRKTLCKAIDILESNLAK